MPQAPLVMRGVLLTGSIALGLVAATGAPADERGPASSCARISAGLTPLSDLGSGSYHHYRGGLYPGGTNTPGPRYLAKGLAAARAVQPLAADGTPSAGGKVVFLSIGMSNTTLEFQEFQREAAAQRLNPALAIVDGAVFGQDAEKIKDPHGRYWSEVDRRLAAGGATGRQVQAVWLKEAIIRPTEAFPADAQRLRADLRAIVAILAQRFPALHLVYVSSRIYGGYASTTLNPEPYAYQSGFAVKWLVNDAIDGKVAGPWVGWGPYLWTDGTKGRKDGLVWTCDDVRTKDGTHPSPSGARKVAGLLLSFLRTSPPSKTWFNPAA